MATGGGAFSAEEMRYLMNLPAVANVTRSRITYAEAFRRSCLRRYINGESPVKLFREAGLDPSLVGYKRIARCFARWKAQAVKNGELTEGGMTLRWDASGDEASCETTPSPCFPSDTSVALRCGANATVGGGTCLPSADCDDVRDLIIAQQARRINKLEHELAHARNGLHEGPAVDADRSVLPASARIAGREDGV